MSHSVTDPKSKEDYYGGPPPPDEVPSSKPNVPAYGTTPVKLVTNPNAEYAANVSPESIPSSNATSHERNATYTQERGEKSFFVSRVILKLNKETKEQNLTMKVNSLQAYAKVNDDP